MTGYVIRRLLTGILILVLLSMVTFLLFNALPTDPAALTCGKSCTPQVIEANRVRLGLDLPLWQQYLEFVKGLFLGRTYGSGSQTFTCDAPALGYSFRRGECVTPLILGVLPVTIYLAVGAFILWMISGVLLGIYAALRRGRWQEKATLGAALVGYSFPSFFIGLLLLFFVVIKWQLLPYPDYVPPQDDPVQFLQTMILPWITLALVFAAFYIRLTRNQMLETLGEDYIRTARAKGLPERTVIRKHGLRAGLTPIVTAAGLDLAGLLGGAIIVESVFTLPGLGRLAINSVLDADLPVITGTVLVAGFFIVVANIIVDLLYAVIDPRVRLT
ncbi:MAG: ABC transporter permease [Actinobacteria bacterium]|nr:ABC transporter permease [Actinomycetota bacterium]